MQTLPEFLKIKENQKVVLEKIIEIFRERGEWGEYGLFAKIAEKIGFSPSYIGKAFNEKTPLRENFVEKMAEYLEVSVDVLTKVEILKRAHSERAEAQKSYMKICMDVIASLYNVSKDPYLIPEKDREEAMELCRKQLGLPANDRNLLKKKDKPSK